MLAAAPGERLVTLAQQYGRHRRSIWFSVAALALALMTPRTAAEPMAWMDLAPDPECMPDMQRHVAGFGCAEWGADGSHTLWFRKSPGGATDLWRLAEVRSQALCGGDFQWPADRDHRVPVRHPNGAMSMDTVALEVYVRCVYLDERQSGPELD